MKFLFVLLISSISLYAQDSDKKLHNPEHVEAFYNKNTSNPLLIYDRVNGKIIDTLRNDIKTSIWYKLAIVKSDYGWFKIMNIKRLPEEYNTTYGFENFWVKSDDFLIQTVNYNLKQQVYIYDLPTRSSNKIHKLDANQEVSITEVNDLWAKIKFTVGKKDIEGWLPFVNQCAHPLTTYIKRN